MYVDINYSVKFDSERLSRGQDVVKSFFFGGGLLFWHPVHAVYWSCHVFCCFAPFSTSDL